MGTEALLTKHRMRVFWFWEFSFLLLASLAFAAPGEDRPIWGGGGVDKDKDKVVELDQRSTSQDEDPLSVRRGLVNSNNPLGDVDIDNRQDRESRCSDYENFGYYCVDFFLCRQDANHTINTSGAGLFEIRRIGDAPESRLPEREHILETACEEPTKVCCQTPSRFIDEQDPETTENPTSEKKFEPIQDKCGVRNKGSGSNDLEVPDIGQSEFGEWPHVCALLRFESVIADGEPVKLYECGASILNTGVVLTAAHCVKGLGRPNNWWCVAVSGTRDTRTSPSATRRGKLELL